MSEWKKVKLDDCLELITYGFTNPMPDTDRGPWKVTAKDIADGRINYQTARHTSIDAFENELTDKSRPVKDDLLLTKDGTLGRLAIVGDERICINQSVALLRVKHDIIYVPYLYYLLSTPLYQGKMLADAGGATIKHIYITRVNQIAIPCPSYEEQVRIATILSRYDSLIENYQKQIKLLEEAAQRLYKEWFVDLRFPGHENTKIVDGVPEGWEKKALSEVSNLKAGGDKPDIVSEERTSDCNIPIYSNGTSNEGLYGYTQVPEITEQSVTISARGSVGYTVLRRKPYLPIVRLISVIPGNIYVGYLYFFLKNTSFDSNGAAQQQITIPMIRNKEITIPCDSIIKSFKQIVEPQFAQIDILKEQIRLLTEARDRLLPKLMSGEIAV